MSPYKSFKHRLFEIVEPGDKEDRASTSFDYFLIVLIKTALYRFCIAPNTPCTKSLRSGFTLQH